MEDRIEFVDTVGLYKIKIHVRLVREQTYEEHQIRLEPKITLIFWAPGERNVNVVVRCWHVWPTLLHVFKPCINPPCRQIQFCLPRGSNSGQILYIDQSIRPLDKRVLPDG